MGHKGPRGKALRSKTARLEQAERRRFPFLDTESQFVRHDAIEI
jgi:hypothetical protein